MAEYLLIILVTFVIIYALVKGCSININISVKQEFSAEDRKLLEDLYNGEGDFKDPKQEVQDSLDNMIKTINDIMLDNTEESNG